jgi:hypothetical protein
LKLVLDGGGSYLGMEKDVRIGEIIVSSGIFISTSVLASCVLG